MIYPINANNDIYVKPEISVICYKDKLTDEECKGAPDWIVEIVSHSSRRIVTKKINFNIYKNNIVLIYLIIWTIM